MKNNNRQQSPETAQFVDDLRRVFSDAKVLYVQDGAFEAGSRPDYSRLVKPRLGSEDRLWSNERD